LWFLSKPPTSIIPQRGEPDPALRALIRKKLSKVRQRGYLQEGLVKSLTSFFTVPKGANDIRLVYNGPSSGLNDCLWVPWFRLPTIEQHLNATVPGTFMADIDIGEQFLNFILHHTVQPFAGVDLTAHFPEELEVPVGTLHTRRTLWVRWTRCGMGFKPSPYISGQGMLHAEELI
jgi:hypothetical protein